MEVPVLLTATGKPRCRGRQCGDKIPGTAPARYTPKQCTRAYVPGSTLPLCKIHEQQKQHTNAAIAAAKTAGKKPDTKNLRSHGIYGEENLPSYSMIGEMREKLDDAVAGAGAGAAAPVVKKAKEAVKRVEVAVKEAVVAGKRADRKKDEVEAAISFAMTATNKAIATLGAVRKSRKAKSASPKSASPKSSPRKTKKSRSSGSSSSGSSSSGSSSSGSSPNASNKSFAREVLARKAPAVIYKPVSASTSPSFPSRPASRSPPSAPWQSPASPATLPRGPNPSPAPESYSPITEASASAPSNGSAISSLSGSPSVSPVY